MIGEDEAGARPPSEESSGELVIDLSGEDRKNKVKTRKKRRVDQTISSEDDSVNLIDGVEEVEENLSSCAAKNNLTTANVKNILKRVVLNEHVLAIVKLREEEIGNSDNNLEPKLTRAKTKKLNSSVSWPLPITPVKVTKSVSPEVTSLISQDLPDEESDEEYNPNFEEHSEDDKDTLESSDLDSLPKTPATPNVSVNGEKSFSEVKYSEDGIFKIPQVVETPEKNPENGEATIALRTRSKLSLNDIPIESIEESFFPPDITKDMYEIEDCQMDDVWRDFIQEFAKPLSNTNEDDDEGDPEYNAAADTEIFDFEELREDAAVEVSRKELKDLVEELFNDNDGIFSSFALSNPALTPAPISSKDLQDFRPVEDNGPIEITDISRTGALYSSVTIPNKTSESDNFADNRSLHTPPISISVCPPSQNSTLTSSNLDYSQNSTCDQPPAAAQHAPISRFVRRMQKYHKDFTISDEYKYWTHREGDIALSSQQRKILDQQMRQHVQLATQFFLQCHAHPKFWASAPEAKNFLTSLKSRGDGYPDSSFHPCNLLPALEVCERWETTMASQSPESREAFEFIVKEIEHMETKGGPTQRYVGKFPDLFYETVWSSDAFPYPHLLPSVPFRTKQLAVKEYFKCEDQLIAMGLEQFYLYLAANEVTGWGKFDPLNYMKVAALIHEHMMPVRIVSHIKRRIVKSKRDQEINPIKRYFVEGKAPPTVQSIVTFDPEKRPKDFPVVSLPLNWQQWSFRRKACLKKKALKASTAVTAPIAATAPIVIPPLEIEAAPAVPLYSLEVRIAEPRPVRPEAYATLVTLATSAEGAGVAEKEAVAPVERGQRRITDFYSAKGSKGPPPSSSSRPAPVRGASRGLLALRALRRRAGRLALEAFAPRTNGGPFLSLGELRESLRDEIDMLPSMPSIDEEAKRGGGAERPREGVVRRRARKRELGANRALFSAGGADPRADDLKETLHAIAYAEKVEARLADCESRLGEFRAALDGFDPTRQTPVELYRKLRTAFGDEHADLAEEFLTFLTPGQADELGKFMDHFMLTCMSEFLDRLQTHYGNKPTQLRKILWSIEKLSERPEAELTTDEIKATVVPLLKGNQHLIDWFLRLFPEEKPPESLVNDGYETIECGRIFNDNGDEATYDTDLEYETLEVPAVEENYGNESCSCSCHDSANEKFKNRSRHCLACGMKYMQGRVYLQNGRSLRAVRLNWDENNKGHADQARRLSAPLPSQQANSRRKGLPIESSAQSVSAKNDSDEERISPKRTVKFIRTPTPKNKSKPQCSRTICKSGEVGDQLQSKASCSVEPIGDDMQIEKTAEKNCESELVENRGEDDLFEAVEEVQQISATIKQEVLLPEECHSPERLCSSDAQAKSSDNVAEVVVDMEEAVRPSTSGSRDVPSIEQSDNENLGVVSKKRKYSEEPSSLLNSDDEVMWTRNEDKSILLILRSDLEYDEMLKEIQSLLPHRSITEISKRVQNVMALLKMIASDS